MQQYDQFRGRDVAEALAQVKAAFGGNSLIGTTRVVTNGRGGALGHSFVEVTAAAGGEAPRKASSFARGAVARTAGRPSERPLRAPTASVAPAGPEATPTAAANAGGAEL